MANPTLVNVSYAGGTLTGTSPASVVQGDILIAFVMAGDNTAQGGPSGWTALNQVNGAGVARASTWAIIRGASAPSFVWTGPGASSTSIEIMAWRGGDSVTATNGSGMSLVLGNSSPAAPSITTTIADDILISLFAAPQADPGTVTIPSGMTSLFNKPSADWFAGAYLNLSGIVTTGTKTWTQTPTQDSFVASVAVRAASASGMPPGLGPSLSMGPSLTYPIGW